MCISKLIRFIRDRRGTTALEFAVIAPTFVMLTFGVMEIGRGLQTYNEMASVASAVSRTAMLNASAANSAIETKVRDLLETFEPEELHIAFSTETVGGTAYRIVEINYPMKFVTPFLDLVDFTMTATSRTPS